mmetsp:Transcript_9814/g.36965  ORF Transcript_9814/g.36965 Transcript_9814/m.36965 type:complete len:260 (+) Transcript_9814:2573-3352(+)
MPRNHVVLLLELPLAARRLFECPDSYQDCPAALHNSVHLAQGLQSPCLGAEVMQDRNAYDRIERIVSEGKTKAVSSRHLMLEGSGHCTGPLDTASSSRTFPASGVAEPPSSFLCLGSIVDGAMVALRADLQKLQAGVHSKSEDVRAIGGEVLPISAAHVQHQRPKGQSLKKFSHGAPQNSTSGSRVRPVGCNGRVHLPNVVPLHRRRHPWRAAGASPSFRRSNCPESEGDATSPLHSVALNLINTPAADAMGPPVSRFD